MPDTRPTFYGTFRESNAHHLEILGQAPALGVPIEVDVFDGASPGTLLDTLEGATGVRFQRVLNDIGAFRFLISRADPKAVPDIIDREHLIKVKMGGVYRFGGWAEIRKLQTLDAQEEEAAEVWEISGRSGIGYLDRAAMANYSLIGDDPIAGVWDLSAAGTGDSIGAMFYRCVQERLAEPGSAIEFITTDFDYDYDSLGAAWADTAKIKVNVGDSLLSIWRTMTALGMDSRMRHDLRLQAFVELGRHFDIDTGDGTVVLEAGKDFTSTLIKTRRTSDIKTREWVKGQTGTYFEAIRPDLEADPYIRRREGSLSFGSSTDPTTLQRAAFADMKQRALAVEGGIEVEVWNGRYQPFVHYEEGDWITIHEPGVYNYKTFRIVAITIEQDEDDHKTTLALNSIELEDLLRLAAKLMGAEMGSSANTTSAVSSGGGGGGGGGTGSDYKVAVETGDEAGFLIDKIEGADGVTRQMVGPVGDRIVQLGLDDTLVQLKDEKGAPNGYAPLSSGLLVPVGYLGAGTPDNTKFLRGDGVWAVVPGSSAPGLLYSSKAIADPIDAEFDGSLGPFVATLGAAGTVDITESGTVAKYDLATRPGWLLTQAGSPVTQQVHFRADQTLPDGASLVVALAPSATVAGIATNDSQQIGITLNTDDAGYQNGNYLGLYAVEVDANAADIQTLGAGSTAGSFATLTEATAIGQIVFLRIARSGLVYRPYVSYDGRTWIPFPSVTYAAAFTNIWLFHRNPGISATPVPITAWAWVRQGTNGIDPWDWS